MSSEQKQIAREDHDSISGVSNPINEAALEAATDEDMAPKEPFSLEKILELIKECQGDVHQGGSEGGAAGTEESEVLVRPFMESYKEFAKVSTSSLCVLNNTID